MQQYRGFTIVELVVVILLLGIISVTATSRYASKSDFSANITRDLAIAISRQIQISAMQQNTSEYIICRTLIINKELFGCNSNNKSNQIITSDYNVIASPELNIKFDLLGRPIDKDGQRLCLRGCDITFTAINNNQARMCINKEGYIHSGACDEV